MPASEDRNSIERIFVGDSEMALRMRAFDWSNSDLGPPEAWPLNLRVALGICLKSRFPLHVWWGPTLTLFYNDGYISFLGRGKHPAVLGRSGREAWAEIWDQIGPMIERVLTTGEASWSEDILMFFDRYLPKEEVYVTFSFSPVYGENDRVDGIFCACTETTEKIIGNRRLDTLRKLGVEATVARSVAEACQAAVSVMGENQHDIPFAGIYLVDEAGCQARLAASVGLVEGGWHLPPSVSVDDLSSPLPFSKVLRTMATSDSLDLTGLGVESVWLEPVKRASVLPIRSGSRGSLDALLVVGVNPRRPLDSSYRTFLDLVAGHIGTAVANARAYEEERRRVEALAELDRAKTLFFSNVSHEFRTPLTLILGPLEDLLGDALQASVRSQIEIVHRNALRMLKLVNSLLDFSRIEAGRIQAVYRPVDLAALTTHLTSVFRSAIEKAGLEFVVSCPELPEPVYVDAEMWEKVVLNLLSNALKFTWQGTITVRQEWKGDYVEMSVEDTGIGIPEEEQPQLFERFHRVPSAKSRTYEGTGIGLALTKELVKLHGGLVEVRSQVSRGTKFTVLLPTGTSHLPQDRIDASRTLSSTATGAAPYVEEALRWLPDSPRNGQAHESSAETAATKTADSRILIVDDNADMRDYLRHLLGTRWSAELVPDGLAALESAMLNPPDLILADVMMPGLDGIGLVRRIRETPAIQTVPVILVSARAGEEARIEGLECGADDYLTKPFSARELIASVSAQLKIAGMRRDALKGEAKLKEIRATHKAKEEATRRLVSTMAHELRNPMAVLLGTLNLMELRLAAGEPVESLISIAKKETTRTAGMLNDVLEAFRFQQKQVSLRKVTVDLGAVITDAMEPFLASTDGSRIRADLEPGNHWVYGDPRRLSDVFRNLLHNALKYSAPNEPVTVSLVDDHGSALVAIKDNGIGIPSEERKSVFEPFYRASNAVLDSNGNGGAGLGLFLSKSIVVRHRGSIRFKSELGKGSVFYVRLPLKKPR